MAIELQELIKAGVYPDADTAIQDALRVLWQERPAVRIEVAVHRYRTEGLSIAKAAALAGVSFDRMKEILADSLPASLHRGEVACLCIARQRVWGFLTDDRAARWQAQAWNIPLSGTIGVLLLAIQDGRLTVEEGNALLRAMIEKAHYHSPTTDLRQILP